MKQLVASVIYDMREREGVTAKVKDGQMVLALSVSPRYARKECLSDVGEGVDCGESDRNLEKGEEFEGEGMWNVKRRAVKSVVRGMR